MYYENLGYTSDEAKMAADFRVSASGLFSF
jgi:hypothetical protein